MEKTASQSATSHDPKDDIKQKNSFKEFPT